MHHLTATGLEYFGTAGTDVSEFLEQKHATDPTLPRAGAAQKEPSVIATASCKVFEGISLNQCTTWPTHVSIFTLCTTACVIGLVDIFGMQVWTSAC